MNRNDWIVNTLHLAGSASILAVWNTRRASNASGRLVLTRRERTNSGFGNRTRSNGEKKRAPFRTRNNSRGTLTSWCAGTRASTLYRKSTVIPKRLTHYVIYLRKLRGNTTESFYTRRASSRKQTRVRSDGGLRPLFSGLLLRANDRFSDAVAR